MIYLDNAATTKTAPEVVEAMLPYFTEFYGNASTVYDFAANSKAAIAKARQQIADVIGAKKEEIYFTAGGSESDNWALKATLQDAGEHGVCIKKRTDKRQIPYVGSGSLAVKKQCSEEWAKKKESASA